MLSSTRLVFQTLNPGDFEKYYTLYSNEKVMKYTYLNAPKNRADCKEQFERVLKETENKTSYEYTVHKKRDGAFIGICDYDVRVRNKNSEIYEIGYFLLPDFWGRGYAFEMSKALIDHLFKTSRGHRIEARCNALNLKSERLMKKLGMTKEGRLRKVRFKEERWDDEMVYAILKEEWRNNGLIHNQADICP